MLNCKQEARCVMISAASETCALPIDWPYLPCSALLILRNPASTCSGNKIIYGCSGDFTDGSSLSGNYDNDLSCFWLLVCWGGQNMELSFSRFDVENGYDFVQVYEYDLDNHQVSHRETLTGREGFGALEQWTFTTTRTLYSSGNPYTALAIKLETDFTVGAPGFRATYSAVTASPPPRSPPPPRPPTAKASTSTAPIAYKPAAAEPAATKPASAPSTQSTTSASSPALWRQRLRHHTRHPGKERPSDV